MSVTTALVSDTIAAYARGARDREASGVRLLCVELGWQQMGRLCREVSAGPDATMPREWAGVVVWLRGVESRFRAIYGADVEG